MKRTKDLRAWIFPAIGGVTRKGGGELRPCPACGGKPKVRFVGDNKQYLAYVCSNCGKTPVKYYEASKTVRHARLLWNKNAITKGGLTMAEYIEREALQTALQRKKAGAANGRYTDGWNDCLMRFKSMISCFPAADVEPVIHARWITGKRLDTGNGFKPVLECSNCHALIPCDDFVATNGCPCCRAKMDGGTDNEP